MVSLLLFAIAGNIYSLSSNPKYVTPSEEYHIVKRWETLSSISDKYIISRDKLKLFNNLTSDRMGKVNSLRRAPFPKEAIT
jgi:LysM repeat protein